MNHELDPKLDHKTAFYLKILLNRRHRGTQAPLLKLLPAEKSDLLGRQNTMEDNLGHALLSPDHRLASIHYSWIAEFFSQVPENKLRLYLASLPLPMRDQVEKLLGKPKTVAPLQGPLKRLIQGELIQAIFPDNYLPLPYLPKTSLSPLLAAPKNKIIELVDFLGIYDLSAEMKKIVDTKLLRSLFLALQPKQQEFLKLCMHQKDQLQTPRFPLKDWAGDASELQKNIHKRGLIRLAKALSNQSTMVLWHIIHKLDTGRGKKLEILLQKEEIPQITAILTAQILQLLKFLEKAPQ